MEKFLFSLGGVQTGEDILGKYTLHQLLHTYMRWRKQALQICTLSKESWRMYLWINGINSLWQLD